MEIHASKGLESLVDRVKSDVVLALKEREDLGLLVPGNFDVNICYQFGDFNSDAFASYGSDKHTIGINMLSIGASGTYPQCPSDYVFLKKYFEIVHDFLGKGANESAVLEAIDDSATFFDKLESGVSKEKLESRKEFFALKSKSYDLRRQYVLQRSNQVSILLRNLMHAITANYSTGSVVDGLRHELDHVAFYDSKFYQTSRSAIKHNNSVLKKSRVGGLVDVSKSVDGFEINMVLSNQSKILLETSAHFFNYVPLNSWAQLRLPPYSTPNKIFDYLTDNRLFAGEMEDVIFAGLIAIITHVARMNEHTFNFINSRHYIQPERRHLEGAFPYDESQVDFDLARKFLNLKADWTIDFMRNINHAVIALNEAYAFDPPRIKKACLEAATFEEFLSTCRGE